MVGYMWVKLTLNVHTHQPDGTGRSCFVAFQHFLEMKPDAGIKAAG